MLQTFVLQVVVLVIGLLLTLVGTVAAAAATAAPTGNTVCVDGPTGGRCDDEQGTNVGVGLVVAVGGCAVTTAAVKLVRRF